MKRICERFLGMVLIVGLSAVAQLAVAAGPGDWSYAGPSGPAKWGKLSKEFALCGTGTMQSPIDIHDADARKGDLPALLFNYKPSPLRIIDDGHTIQVNYAPGSFLTVAGTRYELISIDFHKPSEVKINGKGQEMAAHLLHKGPNGKLAILAVLLDQGSENPVIKTLWSNLPSTKGKENVVEAAQINALGLLPKNKGYFMYVGSLTTPPCTENVTRFVLKTPVEMSADQIARFGRLYPMNARPIQPRNDRDIQGTP